MIRKIKLTFDKGQGGIHEYFKRRAPKPWFWRPCDF